MTIIFYSPLWLENILGESRGEGRWEGPLHSLKTLDENLANAVLIGVISGIGKGVIGEFYCASVAVV